MSKLTAINYVLMLSGVILLVYAVDPTFVGLATGGTGRINIQIKDENGNAIQGVRCQADTVWINSGYTSQLVYDTSTQAGWCYFWGVEWDAGERYGWGALCNNPTGITDQGSVDVYPGMTSNVYVTLDNCRGSGTTTTTSTIQNCGAPYRYRCYNGDVWTYDSCNQRKTRAEVCGTYGCENGECVNPPATTTTIVTGSTTTSTTLQGSCSDVCEVSDECYASDTGKGFRCTLNPKTGCSEWVLDPRCDSRGYSIERILAGVFGIGALLAGLVKW